MAMLAMVCSCGQRGQVSTYDVVNEVIMSRRSIRSYKQVPVGRDTL